MNYYQGQIATITGCSESDVEAIEDIMRNDIVHSTLDWLTKEQFRKCAIEAYELRREIKRVDALCAKLFSKKYYECDEVELRQLQFAI